MEHKALETDHLGFLIDARQWNYEWAQGIANELQLTLTDQDKDIILVLREFYFEYDLSPAMRPLVKLIKNRIGPNIGNSIWLMQRYGESPARVLSQLSGLPKPKNCL